MATYRESEMWKLAMEAAHRVYALAEGLPKKHDWTLGSQLRRAALSVPANMAEGYGRDTPKDYARHLGIARGSLLELGTLLIFGEESGLFRYDERLESMVSNLIAMTHSAQRKLRARVD